MTRFENELAVWETQTDDYVAGAGWSFDGRFVYAASSAGHFYLYEALNGKSVFSEQTHPDGINGIAVSPTAHIVAIAGKDGKIQLRHGETGQIIQTLEGGALWVEHVAWATDGQHLATAAGKTLRIWTTGEPAFEYKEFPARFPPCSGATQAIWPWPATAPSPCLTCSGRPGFLHPTRYYFGKRP